MNRVEGKNVVITGAASGIGRAAAQLMAAEGVKVLVADLNADHAAEAAASIRESGVSAVDFAGDVMDKDWLAGMIQHAVDEFGGLDVLCNHVCGSNPSKDLDRLTRYIAVRYIAVQYGPENIRCNAIAPGAILTPALINNIPTAVIEGKKAANSLPYLGKPDDIANAMMNLASDESRYTTRQTLVLDGGLTSTSPLATGRSAMLALNSVGMFGTVRHSPRPVDA